MRGNGLQLCQATLRLDIGNNLFLERVFQRRAGVESPFLEGFQVHVDLGGTWIRSGSGSDRNSWNGSPRAFPASLNDSISTHLRSINHHQDQHQDVELLEQSQRGHGDAFMHVVFLRCTASSKDIAHIIEMEKTHQLLLQLMEHM
ncbi:hypothetical protein DUI87_15954 [Hirundo rustica rustica]|uniref:Uncharacterized protein n=1 Tax=Hirundo rustica rustica TaxID=333673 RepID=A0A3M0KH88_HIRRU|nr:hypothetical protein DUI87_15954 [Hirundo rustica rustica]